MLFSETFAKTSSYKRYDNANWPADLSAFGKIHCFREHDKKVQSVRQAFNADITSPENEPSQLPHWLDGFTLQSSDGVYLVEVHTVQIFDSFESVHHFYPISVPNLPLHWATWSAQGTTSVTCKLMSWDCHAYIPNHTLSSVESNGSKIMLEHVADR